MSKNTGVISIGVRTPIIREGDDLANIVIGSVKDVLRENKMKIEDGDIIGITESVVARAQGNYITVDDIAQFLEENGYHKSIILYGPLMSRNRFSIVLKGIARYAEKITIVLDPAGDEQGNPTYGINPYTDIDIQKYYTELCDKEGCVLRFVPNTEALMYNPKFETYINANCRPKDIYQIRTLADIMSTPVIRKDGTTSGYNAVWGVLGSNKATDEKLKLFPHHGDAQELVEAIQKYYLKRHKKHVEVLVYGDGCFKSPEDENGIAIWEFADPVTCPAYTRGLDGLPNEIKIKAFADDQFKDLNGEELNEAIKKEINDNRNHDLLGSMNSQGTTPRRFTDLLASLCDLMSGSGDKGCPVVLIKRYFLKYCDD